MTTFAVERDPERLRMWREHGYSAHGLPVCSACGVEAAVFQTADLESDERYCSACWPRHGRYASEPERLENVS